MGPEEKMENVVGFSSVLLSLVFIWLAFLMPPVCGSLMTTAALRSLIFPTHLNTLMIHLYSGLPVRAVCIRANYLYLLFSEQSLPKGEFLADAGSLFLEQVSLR